MSAPSCADSVSPSCAAAARLTTAARLDSHTCPPRPHVHFSHWPQPFFKPTGRRGLVSQRALL
eukprot:scaffold3195_cov100-Isochrysis_galbana.AAC.7